MSILFFLKPIFDMFYYFIYLDYGLMALVILLLLLGLRRFPHLDALDVIVILLALLFTGSLLRNTKGVFVYAKIMFGFILYFLGRLFGARWREDGRFLVLSTYFIVAVNIVILLSGRGFQNLGRAFTFCGMYYFKTDLAAAMLQSALILYFLGEDGVVKRLIIYGAIPAMVVLSNSRIYLILSICIYGIFFLFQREVKTKKVIHIQWRNLVVLLLLLGIGVGMLSMLSKTKLFQDFGFIGFQIDKASDLWNGVNMQGRDRIWMDLLNYFNLQPISSQWIGIDLIFDAFYGFRGKNAHSLYLRTLVSIGYVGLLFLFAFIVLLVKKLNRLEDRTLFYLCSGFMLIYLLSGISGNVLEYTQITWLPMYYCGAAAAVQQEEDVRRLRDGCFEEIRLYFYKETEG